MNIFDFDEIEKVNLDDVITELEGWSDGYTHGAKLSETPHIFTKVLGCLYDFKNHFDAKKAAEEPTNNAHIQKLEKGQSDGL